MSLDVRAAALATGAGGHRGWAAKVQCGLYHTPAADPVADTFGFGDRAIR